MYALCHSNLSASGTYNSSTTPTWVYYLVHIYDVWSTTINYAINLIYCRKLRGRDASKFHAQLCIALLLMLLVFVVGIRITENVVACTAISAFIQYFTLAAAFWMGAEAVLMFKKLIIVFGRTTKTFIIIISTICWGKNNLSD